MVRNMKDAIRLELTGAPVSLVTGGAGFIGSHVADRCIELGHTVVVLDDLSGGNLDNVPPGAVFIRGSVVDDSLVNALFQRYKFDYVYHLAAYAAEGLSHFIRRFNYTNNLVGTVTLLNACVNSGCVKRFVFTSSIAVYGSAQIPMTEATVPLPEDPYGVAKYAAELDLRCAREMFGLAYTIFRPHNVYGERQNIGDRYRNVIGIFMNQVMQDLPMSVYGDGTQTRAFTHIDDVAPLIAESVNLPEAANATFNIGANQPYSVLDLAGIVADAFHVPVNIRHLEARKEVLHAFSSHELIDSVFGRRGAVSLEAGIRCMADWAKSVGPRQACAFGEIEVRRNLPGVWADTAICGSLTGAER